MSTKGQFVNTLNDIIRERGAPTKLISDSAKEETSKTVLKILRYLGIKQWQSDPHHQHQNLAERRYQTLKRVTNTIIYLRVVPRMAREVRRVGLRREEGAQAARRRRDGARDGQKSAQVHDRRRG